MQVIIYFNSSYPYGAAATNRVHQLCKGLHNNEVDVNLIITNATESKSDTLNNQIEGTYEGIRFKYLSKTTLRSKGLLLRKAEDIICYLRTYKHLVFSTKSSGAILVIGGATFDYRVLIPIIARIIRKYVFLEINEYPFVTRKNGSWKLFIEFFFFRFVVPWYNGFIVISEHLAKEIDRYKVRKARIIKIPILSELQELSKSGSSAPCSVPYIIHAGSMIEQKDGIIGSLKAFAMARRELEMDIYYLITGDPSLSPDYDIIKRFIQDEGLEGSVVFTGYLDKNELSDYLHHASLAIVNKSPNKQNEYCFATKISEYIAFGIPMILTRVGEVRHYFTDGYNALIVEPDDVVQLAKAIVKLFSERALVESLASNALKLLAKDFNTDYNGARLKDFLAQNSNQY